MELLSIPVNKNLNCFLDDLNRDWEIFETFESFTLQKKKIRWEIFPTNAINN